MRRAIPLASMSVPATIKNGTASRMKLVTPYCIADGIVVIGASSVITKYNSPASTNTPAIGTPVMNAMISAGTISRNGSTSMASRS